VHRTHRIASRPHRTAPHRHRIAPHVHQHRIVHRTASCTHGISIAKIASHRIAASYRARIKMHASCIASHRISIQYQPHRIASHQHRTAR
jgi:hypothetical protein